MNKPTIDDQIKAVTMVTDYKAFEDDLPALHAALDTLYAVRYLQLAEAAEAQR